MKHLSLKLILIIIFAVIVGIAISIDPGYIYIQYSRFSYQSSVWFTIGILVAIGLLCWGIKLSIELIFSLLGKVNPFSSERKLRSGELGMEELAEGDWNAALKHLSLATKKKQTSLYFFLGAARAANELGKTEQSNNFIKQAYKHSPKATIAIDITAIRLLISRTDYNQAQALAEKLYKEQPNQPTIIELLYSIYLQKEEWSAIKTLLPALKKYKIVPENSLKLLEQHIWITLLKQSFLNNAQQPTLAIVQLKKAWEEIPYNLRKNHELTEIYIQQLCQLEAHQEAIQLLQKTIDNQYQSELVYLLGQIKAEDPLKQLTHAESWLKQHSEDPILLLTLGRISLFNQLWGKAKSYFEASLKLKHSAETCSELAGLLAQLGELQKSSELFQDSLNTFRHALHKMN